MDEEWFFISVPFNTIGFFFRGRNFFILIISNGVIHRLNRGFPLLSLVPSAPSRAAQASVARHPSHPWGATAVAGGPASREATWKSGPDPVTLGAHFLSSPLSRAAVVSCFRGVPALWRRHSPASKTAMSRWGHQQANEAHTSGELRVCLCARRQDERSTGYGETGICAEPSHRRWCSSDTAGVLVNPVVIACAPCPAATVSATRRAAE
jgi:hypothetical protein